MVSTHEPLLRANDNPSDGRSRCLRHASHVRLVWLPLALLLCWLPPAHAHRGSAVWTEIIWRDNHFQITHRLHTADALHINRYMGGSGELNALEDLARLALYVDLRFSLSEQLTLQSPLVTLGAELEDDFAFIYQEWHPAVLPEQFPELAHTLLIDLVPQAQRFIRIETPQGIEERRL